MLSIQNVFVFSNSNFEFLILLSITNILTHSCSYFILMLDIKLVEDVLPFLESRLENKDLLMDLINSEQSTGIHDKRKREKELEEELSKLGMTQK